VNQAPAITSANSTTFVTGAVGTFTVTATGFPTPTISEVGTLPIGVTFSGGKLSGTPTQSGSFSISFTASNGVTPNATQIFTLTVDQPPAITSANHAAFTLGAASSFTVTTTGFPVSTSITELGSLPAGVTFTNNGNGTATLAGTPTTGGTFNIGFTASNGVSPNATQSFTLTTSGPLASIAPSTLSFGTVYLGTLTPKTVTLTNTGNAAMTINDPLLSIAKGGDSSEFVLLSLCPRSLAAGKSCEIIVTFVAGPFFNPQTAMLSIMDNAPGSPQQIGLTAQVIDPLALPSLTNWNFGTQKVGTSSTAKVVTLSNPGLTALTVNSIALSGGNSSDFSETNNCPASLAPKGSCTIDVTFKPTAKGSRSSSIVITDNAFNSPQKISLSGTGD
jgi:Abnormal spindle-like microcephaly-assoc'd, ASPM-SPD-2-Hydin